MFHFMAAQNHLAVPATVLQVSPGRMLDKLQYFGQEQGPEHQVLDNWTTGQLCSAPFLGKPEFLNNSGRYHKMVSGRHKEDLKLQPTKV